MTLRMHSSFRGPPAAEHAPLAVATLAAILALGGCVTETVTPSRGTPVAGGGSTAVLERGPVARPATDARTTVSSVQVAVAPLGVIEYDGMSLPLVSPDGRFTVARVGATPGWPAVLATAGAAAPAAGNFVVHSIADRTMVRLEPDPNLPAGCLLGRDCDTQGFLIERVNADGSRSIGKVPWLGGGVRWLVDDGMVNAHAVIHEDGLLLVRRAVDETAWALVLMNGSGEAVERNAAGGTYTMPLPSAEPGIAWALRTSAGGTEVESIRIGQTGFGSTLSRTLLTGSDQPAASYQLAASVAKGGPIPEGDAALPLAILSTRSNGVVAIDTNSGRATLLSRGAIAAAPVALQDARGYICTRDDGLVYVPEDVASGAARNDARLLSVPFVVRPTASESAPFVLFGPVANAPDRLEVFRMAATSKPR